MKFHKFRGIEKPDSSFDKSLELSSSERSSWPRLRGSDARETSSPFSDPDRLKLSTDVPKVDELVLEDADFPKGHTVKVICSTSFEIRRTLSDLFEDEEDAEEDDVLLSPNLHFFVLASVDSVDARETSSSSLR